MAFNPFHGFRKHQKVFFAALAIMCMITFVLSGSSGVFQEISHWFVGSRVQGAEVASLFGKPVSENELRQTRLQREIANLFMSQAVGNAAGAATEALPNLIKDSKLDKPTQEQLNRILGEWRTNLMFGLQFDLPQFRRDASYYAQQLNQSLMLLDFYRHRVAEAQQTNEANLIQTVAEVLKLDYELLSRGRGLYFGGTLEAKDLLDFLIWRRQADLLGIQLGQPEVRSLVQMATRNQLSKAANHGILRALRKRYGGVSDDLLMAALTDEFRVRLAQEAILGSELQFYDQVRTGLTPYEFWQFYQKQRTESIMALLPIPVDNPDFLKQVGEPTEEELKSLYDKAKDKLYDPASPDAGFKQPTRIELEWVNARPDSPYFQKAAQVALGAVQATMPLAYELALLSEYRDQSYRFQSPLRSPSWIKEDAPPHETSAALGWAAAVGQGLGSGGSGPALLATLAAYQGTSTTYETQGRIRAGATLVLSGATGSVLTTAATAAAGSPATEYVPLDRVKPLIAKALGEKMEKHLVSEAVKELEKELRERAAYKPRFPSAQGSITDAQRLAVAMALGASEGPAPLAAAALAFRQESLQAAANGRAAVGMMLAGSPGLGSLTAASLLYRDQNLGREDLEKIVAKAVERFGLRRGATTRPRDQYDLGQDEGLAPLRDAVNGHWANANPKQFGPETFKKVERVGLYEPQDVPPQWDSDDRFLYWKTAEKGAYVPSFEEARPKVVARWKFEKARPLARKEADEVVAKIPKNTTGGDAERVLRDGSPHAGKFMILPNVARLVEPLSPTAQPPGAGGFQRYHVPAAQIEYSSDELVNKLLELKEPGQATVVHDQPEAHYYAAVLVQRIPAYEENFARDARRPDSLLDWYEKETKDRERNKEACLKQLRADAGLVVDEENLKKVPLPRMGEED